MTNAIKQKAKYSGVEWVGAIPENWKTAKLKQVVSIKITDGPHETPEFLLEGVPFASAEAVFDGKINFEHIRGYISEEQDIVYSEKCKPIKNDIFIVKSGSTTGKVAVIEEDVNFNVWSPLALVRVNKSLAYYKFVYYFLSSDSFQKQVQIFWSFGTQPNIGMNVLENLFLTLPPLATQKLISEYLDAKSEQVKKFIDDKKKLISLLQEQKRAVIYNAVTKGTNSKVEMKSSGVDWLGDIPKDWRVLKLKHGVKLNIHKSIDHVDKNVALENIEGWTGKLIETDGTFEGEGNLFEKGDVLFGKLRPYLGKVYLSEYSGRCVNEILVFTPNENILNNDYLYYLCSSSEFIKIVDSSTYGSKMPRAEWDFIGKMEVPIPKIETQKEIVNYIEKNTRKIDQAIHTVQQEIELIEEYKKSLIYQAVTGKIESLLTNE